jgi:hypothetical protein
MPIEEFFMYAFWGWVILAVITFLLGLLIWIMRGGYD